MRPASLLLALSLLACEGDPAPTPPPDDRAGDDGSGGTGSGTGSGDGAGEAPGDEAPGAPVPTATVPAGATLERIDDVGDCAGLVPERVPEPVVVRRDAAGASCAGGISDGSGAVALAAVREGGVATWQAYGADGTPRAAFEAEPTIVPDASGWHAIVVTPGAADVEPRAEHVLFGSDGRAGARATVTPDPAQASYFRWRLSPDPRGGALVVVRSTNRFGNHWSAVTAHRFDAAGRARWPGGVAVSTDDSALEPMFLGGGVSTGGDALVLAQDSAFLDASWLDGDGHGVAASDRGERSDDVVGPGVDHAIDVLSLLDGALAVRSDGAFRRTYGARAIASAPLPTWLAERASWSFRFTRGNAGYAVLPPAGRPSADCTQRIDLVSPSGRLCGRVALREEGGACTTGIVDQGWDGTVVQQSARDACTYRWWPGLLGR
jgi:hypothetical protein